jgi:hypothetical protein
MPGESVWIWLCSLLGGVVGSAIFVYGAAYLYARRMFHKPKPLPYNNLEDFGLTPPELFSGPRVYSRLAAALSEIHNRDGLRASFFEIIFKEDQYTLSAMWQDMVREPKIRWSVAFFLLPNLLTPSRGPMEFNLGMPRRNRFNGQFLSLFDIAFMVEEILHGLEAGHAEGKPWAGDLHRLLDTAAETLVAGADFYPGSATFAYRYTNDPQLSHPGLNRMLKRDYFFWNDLDSTSCIRAALHRYLAYGERRPERTDPELRRAISELLETGDLLSLLDRGCRRVGDCLFPAARRRLGALCDHHAYTIWFEGDTPTNDIDPTVIVNVLLNLVRCRRSLGTLDRPATLAQVESNLHYLEDLVSSGLLFDQAARTYYSPVVLTYSWRRLAEALSDMSAEERARFDPGGRTERIGARIAEHWAHRFFSNPTPRPVHPLNLLLLARAFPERMEQLERLAAAWQTDRPTPVVAELFRGAYPTGVLWGNAMYIFALAFALQGPNVGCWRD